MIRQIEMADNSESIELFYKYLPATAETPPTEISDVPLNVLLPAFMISELKVAFLLGFQIYLPFLVLDLVVSSVTVSMGMLMLPPNMISFPLKLILFVLVDGWNLVVGMLLQSFGHSRDALLTFPTGILARSLQCTIPTMGSATHSFA